TITSSTGTANAGGGIYTGTNPATASGNTIFALNLGADVSGPLASQGHNLIGDGTGGSGFNASDLVGTAQNPIDPKLGPLQDNGGPTKTPPPPPRRPAHHPRGKPPAPAGGPGRPPVPPPAQAPPSTRAARGCTPRAPPLRPGPLGPCRWSSPPSPMWCGRPPLSSRRGHPNQYCMCPMSPWPTSPP